ncbi:MAG TPA: hypothetical protein VFF68_08360 [Anaerolineaceae bacterium]|nr:hypothetical protein [Anaerolineaceae bacterium]
MKSNLLRWIKKVEETHEHEIDCTACLKHISRYVDLELATGEASVIMPEVSQHLYQCGICRDEYEVLRELAHLENAGEPPTTADLVERLKQTPRKSERSE